MPGRRTKADDDPGFTLVELLVACVLLAILVAITIPIYVQQRERAWDSATRSDLRNAKVALETYFTSHTSYDASALTTSAYGFSLSPGVTLDAEAVSGSTYCVSGRYNDRGSWFSIGSDGGGVVGPHNQNPC